MDVRHQTLAPRAPAHSKEGQAQDCFNLQIN